MRVVLVVALCAAALGGCVTKAEQASEIAEQADILCTANGVPRGSASYENCRLSMMGKLLDVKASERAARGDAIAEAGARAGAALMAPRPQDPSFTCRSNTFAGTTTTNCF